MRRWNVFWTNRSQADRVEIYTRWSLYLLIWWMAVAVLGWAPAALEEQRVAGLMLVVGVLLAGTTTEALRRVMTAYPDVELEERGLRRSVIAVVVVAGAGLAASALLPTEGRTGVLAIVLATTAWAVGAVRPRWVAYGVPLAAAAAGLLLLDGHVRPVVLFLAVHVFFVFTLRTSLWVLGVVRELDVAKTAQSDLAVAEERLRFSRDVHDVLGRHLSTIAVRSELAATLADRGDPRAVEAMLEVRGSAHEALREARALARGYRRTDFPTEVEGARSLLSSAGIGASIDVDGLPDAWHEPAAWVVREATTNVLRHSHATAVEIAYEAGPVGPRGETGVLVVRNDGAPDAGPGAEPDDGGGTGILGLRERLAPLGARLDVRRDAGTFALVAHFGAAVGDADRSRSPKEDA